MAEADTEFNRAAINAAGFAAVVTYRSMVEQGRFLIPRICPEYWRVQTHAPVDAETAAQIERGAKRIYNNGAY